MATKLKKLSITKVDLCRAGADPDAHIEIFKSLDTPETRSTEEQQMSQKIDFATAKPEDVVAYAKTLEAQVLTLTKGKVACADDEEPDGDEATPPFKKKMKKSADVVEIPAAVQKKLDDAEAVLKTQAETIEKQAKEIATERTAREIADIKKSVTETMASTPGTVDEVAKMLHQAQQTLTKENYAVLEKALKAGSEAITKAGKEVGADDAVPVGSALDEINKKAEALVTAGVAKSMPDAISQVAKANPDLYVKYTQETKGRR